jgi:hypothetical protein
MKKRNKNKLYYGIGIGIIVLVLGVSVAVAQTGGFWDKVAERTAQILSGKIEIPEEPTFGAIPGDTVNSPCFTVNGVTECSYTVGLTRGTSTPAYIKSPNATTTLIYFPTAYFNYASTSQALLVDIAKSTTQYASTTVLGGIYLDAAAGGLLVGSSTTALPDQLVAPNSYIMVKMSCGVGASCTYSAPSGYLKAQFRYVK